MTIIVCPLHEVEDAVRRHRPAHALSLLSPGSAFPELHGPRTLRLEFHDIAEPQAGLTAPCSRLVGDLIAFLSEWRPPEPLLVHCWAGVSRSTASAYVAACMRDGPGAERDIAQNLRKAAPHATPNPLIVSLADAALGRDGAMIRAVGEIGRGEEVSLGRTFVL